MSIQRIYSLGLLLIGFGFIASCNPVKGEGMLVTAKRNIDNFNQISTQISGDVIIKQGSEFEVHVRGQKNILPFVMTELQGNVLNIHYKNKTNLGSHKKIEVFITMPSVQGLKLLGSGNIVVKDTLHQTDNIELQISGSGSIGIGDMMQESGFSLNAAIVGSGDINLKSGTTDHMILEIDGSGSVNAADLKADRAVITIAGSGNAKVNVSDQLKAQITGSGNAYYVGSPGIEKQIVGSGKVNHL